MTAKQWERLKGEEGWGQTKEQEMNAPPPQTCHNCRVCSFIVVAHYKLYSSAPATFPSTALDPASCFVVFEKGFSTLNL